MRVRTIKNKFLVYFLCSLLLTSIFTGLFTATPSYAATTPPGVGSWYATDPTYSDSGDSLTVGTEVFTKKTCPQQGDVACVVCYLTDDSINMQCRFDNISTIMFVSNNILPDNQGNNSRWGLRVFYAADGKLSSTATLFKIATDSATVDFVAENLPIQNSGKAEPKPVDPNSIAAKFFTEPYISGGFVSAQDGALPAHALSYYTIYQVNSDGSQGQKIGAVNPAALTAVGMPGEVISNFNLNATDESHMTSENGKFITISGDTGLPDGRYIIAVDALADSEVLKQMGEAFWRAFWGPLGIAYDLTVCLSDPIKCINDNLLKTELHVVGSETVTIANGKSVKDVQVKLRVVAINPLDKALSSALTMFGGFLQSATKMVMNWIDSLLSSTADYVIGTVNCSGNACGVIGPWTAMRNIGLTLLVLALIIIAFANALQIDIEQYGLNRMIPKIIVSIIMAFSSWVIVIFFFDFTRAIQRQAIGLLGGTSGLQVLGGLTLNSPTSVDIVAKAGAVLTLMVLLVGILICGVVLLFTLLMRVVMLSFLVAVAPLAFILNIVPFTSSLYKKWWDEFFKWMFMGPIALVILSLGSVIAASVSGGQFGSGATIDVSQSDGTTGVKILIGLLIFGASMYVAAELPKQWGGNLMKGWSGMGKKAWGKTGGALLKSGSKAAWGATGGKYVTKPIAGAWKGWRGDVDRKNQMGVDQRANALLQTASGGKYGTDASVLKQKQFDAEVKTAGDSIGVSTAKDSDLVSRYKNSKNPYEQRAIERTMANRGNYEKLFAANYIDPNTNTFYDDKDPEVIRSGVYAGTSKKEVERNAKIAAGNRLVDLAGSDTVLEESVKDKQGEIFAAAAIGGSTYGKALKSGFMAGQKGKAGHQKRTQAMEFLSGDDAKGFITPGDVKQIMGKDGDAKKQGHLADFVARGAASAETSKAYFEESPKAETELLGSMGRSLPATTAEQTTAEAENEAKNAPARAAAAATHAASPAGRMDRVQEEAERVNAQANVWGGNQQAADQAARAIDDENKR